MEVRAAAARPAVGAGELWEAQVGQNQLPGGAARSGGCRQRQCHTVSQDHRRRIGGWGWGLSMWGRGSDAKLWCASLALSSATAACAGGKPVGGTAGTGHGVAVREGGGIIE